LSGRKILRGRLIGPMDGFTAPNRLARAPAVALSKSSIIKNHNPFTQAEKVVKRASPFYIFLFSWTHGYYILYRFGTRALHVENHVFAQLMDGKVMQPATHSSLGGVVYCYDYWFSPPVHFQG
jgi:hypothetical protein